MSLPPSIWFTNFISVKNTIDEMRKIIVAFDQEHYPEACLQLAGELHRSSPVFLTAIILSFQRKADYWNYAGGLGKAFLPEMHHSITSKTSEHITRLKSFCNQANIALSIHDDTAGFTSEQLIKETQYADLLLIEGARFFNDNKNTNVNEFLEEILCGMHCPAIILPAEFHRINKIVLTCDDSFNALFAIKQSAYLLPEFTALPAKLVFFTRHAQVLEHKQEIMNYSGLHYRLLSMVTVDTEMSNTAEKYFSSTDSSLVVCGSYGKPGILQAFRKSFINNLLLNHKLPIFIAHR